jgi:hypothetical protein
MIRRHALLAILLALSPGAAAAGTGMSASHAVRVTTVTLDVRHRVFHNFDGRYEVKLNEEFPIGDSDFSGKVVRYVPDFTMNLATHQVTSRSNEPNNPAFQIIVRQKKVPQDTTWAMLRMPPHFSKKSMLAFQVLRVDFVGRTPLVADTLTMKSAMTKGTAR